MMASPALIANRPRMEQTPRPRPAHLDYESFWTTEEQPGWLDRVLDQAATWLRDRLHLDLDLSVDGEVRSPDHSKRAQTLHRTASKSRGVRLRVRNANRDGTFIVTVLAVESLRGGWLQITVTCSDPSRVVRKPAVADQFLDVVEFADVTALRSQAEYTSVEGLEPLEALIGSPDRRLPVIVAAPLDDVPFDSWNALVDRWTTQTAGIAHVISLAPPAAQEFASRHRLHAVLPGTLRTYPAGADLSDPLTAKTARWLSHRSLAGDDKAVAKTIESFVRQHAASQALSLPSAAREWSRAFDRIASGKLRAAVTPAHASLSERRELFATRQRELAELRQTPALQDDESARTAPPVPEPSAAPVSTLQEIEHLRRELVASQAALAASTQKLRTVQETLMLDGIDEESLLGLLELATRTVPDQSAIDTLLDTNDSLQNRIEGLEEDVLTERSDKIEARKALSRLEDDYGRARREIEYLRSKVAEHSPEAAYSFTDQGAPQNPLGECPATWEMLADRRDLSDHGIILTASVKKIKDLETVDADGSALTAAWDALGTLAAYRNAVCAGTWDRDVHDFCESGPLGQFRVPPNKHSRGETGSTKQDNRYRKARLLPVPSSVEQSGMVHMWAHFKPYTWTSEKRLRIHYHDQVRSDGAIYVGHVGEHLPSASTTKLHR